MNKQQALNQLRLMQAWHEDNGNGPCPDYDAICYAINIIEEMPEIIRCKDCKHLFNKDDEGGKCWHFNGFSKVVSYDDFCSRAERRTNE